MPKPPRPATAGATVSVEEPLVVTEDKEVNPGKPDKYRGPKDAEGDPHGQGRLELSCGDVFVGEFVNGEMHGHGTHVRQILTHSLLPPARGSFFDTRMKAAAC